MSGNCLNVIIDRSKKKKKKGKRPLNKILLLGKAYA